MSREMDTYLMFIIIVLRYLHTERINTEYMYFLEIFLDIYGIFVYTVAYKRIVHLCRKNGEKQDR